MDRVSRGRAAGAREGEARRRGGAAVPDAHRDLSDAAPPDRGRPRRVPEGPVGHVGARRARERRRGRAPRVRGGRRGALRIRSRRRGRSRSRRTSSARGPRCRAPCATSSRAAAGENPNRLYVVEATPSLTGARADHRRPMTPSEIEAFAASVAVAVGAISSAAPTDPFVEAVAADLKAHRGASLVVAGDAAAAAGPRARARDQRSARKRRQDGPLCGARGRRRPRAIPASRSPSSSAEMAAGRVSTLVIVGGNPVYDAPADLEFAKAMGKVPLRDPPGPLRRRDLAALPLARRRGPRPRGLERRARGGRHGHDPPAADRAALFRQVRPRAARRVLDRAGTLRARHRQGRSGAGKLPGGDFEFGWRKALHDGLVADSASPAKTVTVRDGFLQPGTRNAAAVRPDRPLPARPDRRGTARYSNNGWLQELAETADEADLGERRARRAGDRREARRHDRGRRRA